MRQTAAEARRLLIQMGGEKLGLAPDQLTVTDGVVHSISDPAKRVTYAELIGGRQFDAEVQFRGEAQQLAVKVNAPLKKPEEFKVIGKPYPRRDMPGKVFGTLQQVADLKLPNMAHARMVRPPVAGAVPVSVDEKSISDIPGAKVVWIKDFLGVVAEKEWNAVKAARQLKVTLVGGEAEFPRPRKPVRSYSRCAGGGASGDPVIVGFAAQRDAGRLRIHSSRRCSSLRANTNIRSCRMPAWDPPAPSPM